VETGKVLGDFDVNLKAFKPLFRKVVRRLDAGHIKEHTITP